MQKSLSAPICISICATGGGGGRGTVTAFPAGTGFYSWNQSDHAKFLNPFELVVTTNPGSPTSGTPNGTNGSNASFNNLQTALQMPITSIHGTLGGQSSCSSTITRSGSGGNGIIVIAKTIIINGTINLSGNAGVNGSSTTCEGGSGGGGGGSAIFSSVHFNLNGSFISTGGQGGTRCCSSTYGNGGNGGNGTYVTIELQE